MWVLCVLVPVLGVSLGCGFRSAGDNRYVPGWVFARTKVRVLTVGVLGVSDVCEFAAFCTGLPVDDERPEKGPGAGNCGWVAVVRQLHRDFLCEVFMSLHLLHVQKLPEEQKSSKVSEDSRKIFLSRIR